MVPDRVLSSSTCGVKLTKVSKFLLNSMQERNISPIFHLYHGENKLQFDLMMMTSTLY